MEPKNTALAVPFGFLWAPLDPLGGPLGFFDGSGASPFMSGVAGAPVVVVLGPHLSVQ